MANAFLFPHPGALDNGVVPLNLVFTSGASGAVPTTLTRSNGFSTVTRSGTGTYDVVLREVWQASIQAVGTVVQSTWAAAGAAVVNITADTIATDGKFSFNTCKVTDGTAVDMSSGDILRLSLDLQMIRP